MKEEEMEHYLVKLKLNKDEVISIYWETLNWVSKVMDFKQ